MTALPLTRAALAALDAGGLDLTDVADVFASETAAYNRADQARELVMSPAGLAWLRRILEVA